MERLEDIKKQIKSLEKQEYEILNRMSNVSRSVIYKKDDRWFVDRKKKQAYCKIRDEELIPIQNKIFDLEKKK